MGGGGGGSPLTLLADMSELGITWSINVAPLCFDDDVIDKADVNLAGTVIAGQDPDVTQVSGDFVVCGRELPDLI